MALQVDKRFWSLSHTTKVVGLNPTCVSGVWNWPQQDDCCIPSHRVSSITLSPGRQIYTLFRGALHSQDNTGGMDSDTPSIAKFSLKIFSSLPVPTIPRIICRRLIILWMTLQSPLEYAGRTYSFHITQQNPDTVKSKDHT